MATLREKQRAIQVASLKAVEKEMTVTLHPSLEILQHWFDTIKVIDGSIDIFWALRNTDIGDRYMTYQDMVDDFSTSEAYLAHGLDGLGADGILQVIVALKRLIRTHVDMAQDVMTWNGQEGFSVHFRDNKDSWWLKGMDDRGNSYWEEPLGVLE